jgi:hypothetical protein
LVAHNSHYTARREEKGRRGAGRSRELKPTPPLEYAGEEKDAAVFFFAGDITALLPVFTASNRHRTTILSPPPPLVSRHAQPSLPDHHCDAHRHRHGYFVSEMAMARL